MANEATATDQYVRREIEKFGVRYDEQGSSHPEISKALKGASKQGKSGIGKPEALKYLDGLYSRRIDEKNRLVYKIDELGNIEIISCKGHYE